MPQTILAIIGILAVLFSIIKVFRPEVRFKVRSFYYTLNKEHKGIFILKIQTISNVDLILEDVSINVNNEDGSSVSMVPYSVRWKSVIFKMLDIKQRESDYKLLKPLEPDLRICGIRRGSNECYICMLSSDRYEDKRIISWSFDLNYRHHLLPIPNLPWFNKKTINVGQPEVKDLYFDDSLFVKITAEERGKIIDEL